MESKTFTTEENAMDELAIVACTRAHHENWLKDRRAQGWTHGLIHDGNEKKNPYLLEFDDLPTEQQTQEIAGLRGVFEVLGLPRYQGISRTRDKLGMIDW